MTLNSERKFETLVASQSPLLIGDHHHTLYKYVYHFYFGYISFSEVYAETKSTSDSVTNYVYVKLFHLQNTKHSG